MAADLLFQTFPKKATYLIGLGCEGRARKILADIFQLPEHRLSYEYTDLAMDGDQVVGIMVLFPGSLMGKLNRRLYLQILKHYKFTGKLKLIQSALPVLFVKETTRDEYFLSNLAVKRQYRNRGIGEKMLKGAEELAKAAGSSKISLIVNLENQNARRFYERHGYHVKALNLVTNRHVPHLGPGSERRVKELSQ